MDFSLPGTASQSLQVQPERSRGADAGQSRLRFLEVAYFDFIHSSKT